MKIIKPPDLTKVFTGTCQACGCEFEASITEVSEARHIYGYCDPTRTAVCPGCGHNPVPVKPNPTQEQLDLLKTMNEQQQPEEPTKKTWWRTFWSTWWGYVR